MWAFKLQCRWIVMLDLTTDRIPEYYLVIWLVPRNMMLLILLAIYLANHFHLQKWLFALLLLLWLCCFTRGWLTLSHIHLWTLPRWWKEQGSRPVPNSLDHLGLVVMFFPLTCCSFSHNAPVNGTCGRLNNGPKRHLVLIPGTCKCYFSWKKASLQMW